MQCDFKQKPELPECKSDKKAVIGGNAIMLRGKQTKRKINQEEYKT